MVNIRAVPFRLLFFSESFRRGCDTDNEGGIGVNGNNRVTVPYNRLVIKRRHVPGVTVAAIDPIRTADYDYIDIRFPFDN